MLHLLFQLARTIWGAFTGAFQPTHRICGVNQLGGQFIDRPVWFDYLLNSAFGKVGEQGREAASFHLDDMGVEDSAYLYKSKPRLESVHDR